MSKRADALVGRLWANAGRCFFWAQKLDIKGTHAGNAIVEAIDFIEAQQKVVEVARKIANGAQALLAADHRLELCATLRDLDTTIGNRNAEFMSEALAEALAQAKRADGS